MNSVILWKEYREHRGVWLVFAVLAVGILIGLPIVFAADFEGIHYLREVMGIIGMVLAWAYGTICGGMMLAEEREAGTEQFLDTLPGSRGRLWLGKWFAGSVFVGTYVVVIAIPYLVGHAYRLRDLLDHDADLDEDADDAPVEAVRSAS